MRSYSVYSLMRRRGATSEDDRDASDVVDDDDVASAGLLPPAERGVPLPDVVGFGGMAVSQSREAHAHAETHAETR